MIRECLRRRFADNEYYIGIIEPAAGLDEEEVSYGLLEAEEDEPDSPHDISSS